MNNDYQCGECWEWIRVNSDGTEDVYRLVYPDGDIDYDEEHKCLSIDMSTNEDIPRVAHILESEEKNADT